MATEALHAIGTALKKGDGGLGVGSATAVAGGGNVGDGTMGAITVGAAQLGVYTLTIIATATNAGTFMVTPPGAGGPYIGTVGVAFTGGGLSFTLADGATDFAAGDTFAITVATLAESFVTIAELMSINGMNLQADVKDVTNIHTPWEEVITTIKRTGTITCDANFVPNNAAQQALIQELINNTKSNYQIVFPDIANSTWSFAGYVTKFSTSAKVADQLMATVEFKPTGEPLFS